MSQVAHQAGAYPGFCSIKRLGIFQGCEYNQTHRPQDSHSLHEKDPHKGIIAKVMDDH